MGFLEDAIKATGGGIKKVADSAAPVRGRVCMNMIMIDVTDVAGVNSGDVCTLLGADGDERISAEQLATWMGTIHYEVVARLPGELPRRST
jgi:alanine racemase